MAQRNELFEAAVKECRNAGVEFSYEETRDRHIKLFIKQSPMIVLISSKRRADVFVKKQVQADVRRSISKIIKERC